jgi:hypothetical protein
MQFSTPGRQSKWAFNGKKGKSFFVENMACDMTI